MTVPKSETKIRELVKKLLDAHGVTTPPIPVESIVQKEGAELRYLPYDGDLSGMIFRDEDRIIIGVNSLHHPNRQRFTIAHECGHMLLHKTQEVFVDRAFEIKRRDDVSAQAIDPEEIDANQFAAELLMPQVMLEEDLANQPIDMEDEEAMKKLAKKYKVSLPAMTFRISNLMKMK